MRKLFEERHPVRAPFTMGDIGVHDCEVAVRQGKCTHRQDHLILMGVLIDHSRTFTLLDWS
ncbi:MAG: hypothetical protein Ct9H300mP15_23490 [Gemmatimonadota bacterium]|nr:MAG: hypothetical protein Ct9H300mP15_23490 [Gemmatimonadota bacterium]